MPKVGDRVVFPGLKVGGASRSGQLTEVSEAAVRVRWDDGSTSFLVPGPGAMQVENGASATKKASVAARKPATKKVPSAGTKKAAPKKLAPGAAKKASSKKKR